MPVIAPVVGVELVIAEILKCIAVKLVGAGFDHYANDPALEIAELGGSVIGDHPKFLDGVGIGLIGSLIFCCEIVIDAVEQEIIALLAVSVHIGTAVPHATAAVIQRGWIGRDYAGRE